MKTILVVDDEEVLLWSLSKELSNTYKVFTAKNGLHAVEILQKNPEVEVLVTDIRMPEMDGLELIEAAKRILPSIKVVVMTAFGSPAVQEEVNRRGSMYYLEKPFVVSKLLQVIADVLGEGFAGTVMSLQLCDVIQIIYMGRKSVTFHIHHQGKQGCIVFKAGEVMHAVCENLQGEEAFFQLMFWDGGHFDMLPYQEPQYRTITQSCEYLLFEGMRRKDEWEHEHKQQQSTNSTVSASGADIPAPTFFVPPQWEQPIKNLLKNPNVEDIVLIHKKQRTWKNWNTVTPEKFIDLYWLLGNTGEKLTTIFTDSFRRHIYFAGTHAAMPQVSVFFWDTADYYLAFHLKDHPDEHMTQTIEKMVQP